MNERGIVSAVCISTKRSDPKKNVGAGFLRTGWGLVGDSHAGTEKEISLLAEEDVRAVCGEAATEMTPGSFAENIRTEGLDLLRLKPGTLLKIGRAQVRVIQIGKDLSAPHTYQYRGYSLLPTHGLFGRVVEDGEVKIGDPIYLVKP
jgi:MOSC domain-containing protein YiiM